MMNQTTDHSDLGAVKVLAVLNSVELFGHERGNIEVFKALRHLGAEVRIAVNVYEEGGEVAQYLHELGFETFELPFGKQWSLIWLKKEGLRYAARQLMAVWRCSWLFAKEISRFKPTHIHLGSSLAYSFISLALLRYQRIPLVWRMGDCPPVDSSFNLQIWRAGMKRTRTVVANSEFVRRLALLSGVPTGKISKLYNLAPGNSNFRESYPAELAHGEFAIIYIGAIAAHKGLIPLLEAFSLVLEEHSQARLWVLGGSRWDHEFRETVGTFVRELGIEDKVVFTGHVQNPMSWFQSALIHVVPSIWAEAGANVAMEAKRSGTPSIAFPSGGLPEVIRHQVDGYVCEEKTAESLANALEWILSEPGRAEAMGAAAQEDFAQRFGRERFLSEWASVYTDVR